MGLCDKHNQKHVFCNCDVVLGCCAAVVIAGLMVCGDKILILCIIPCVELSGQCEHFPCCSKCGCSMAVLCACLLVKELCFAIRTEDIWQVER